MTYAEIIKHLEVYSDGISGMHEDFDLGLQETCVNAIDFINRQKAEIERLKVLDGWHDSAVRRCKEVEEKLRTAKSEAYKECIETINKNLNRRASFGSTVESIICEIIISENDNLLKEMVGENDVNEKAKE